MKRKLLTLFALIFSVFASANAQTGTISGKAVDEETLEPLIGANVIVKGTTKGSVTNLDGEFKITDVEPGNRTIEISFIGYQTKEMTVEVNAGEETQVGELKLPVDAVGLQEIVVLSSVAIDRKTPVAVSTIKSDYIVEKASNQEFPELLKATPGVYATKQGGGYGDSRINLRGFESENVAVLINGVPVNDMENGRVYWSNWAGLVDVTRSMQVQRGLGASKVAVPSIGGTINIITRSTDMEQGGYVYYGTGNNNYSKGAFSYSSGLSENGWAFSAQGAKITGDGWADGLAFDAYNYFFNVSKIINDEHTLSLTGFGAPQWHGQRQTRLNILEFRDSPRGRRTNVDYGILNGETVSFEDNFYHKPQFSLNHYWTIDDKSELSTALYASIGTGGGGGTATVGDFRGVFGTGENAIRTGGTYSPVDLDAITDINAANQTGQSLAYLRASRNDHEWYGILSTYTNRITSNIDLLAGIDLRSYKGIHFQEVTNLLGGEYAVDNNDINNPIRRVGVGDKISYYNDGLVNWYGGFLQGEYSENDLSAFATLSFSNTSYKRVDYFQYVPGNQETDWQNFFGYQVKAGANYNLTKNHNVFANVGYFEKAPDFDAVFLNFENTINENAENQKITSYELGYGYRSTNLNVKVNLYRTRWMDRTFTRTFFDDEGNIFFANILGVNALHQGIELEGRYALLKNLEITGMVSIGDWTWEDNVNGVTVFDENQDSVATISTLFIEGLKVGDAAQTTAALGINFRPIPDIKIGMDYNYYDNLFADYDPVNRTGEDDLGIQAWEVPAYGLLDLNIVFDFQIGELKSSVFANVNNVFDEVYISDARDATRLQDVQVYYGIGRTWTAGLKIKF